LGKSYDFWQFRDCGPRNIRGTHIAEINASWLKMQLWTCGLVWFRLAFCHYPVSVYAHCTSCDFTVILWCF